jgi:glycosyltransferase involved in cell wall biosynthesis
MAEAVYDLVRDRTRAEAYGEAGRQRAVQGFSLQASTARIERLYAELAGAEVA